MMSKTAGNGDGTGALPRRLFIWMCITSSLAWGVVFFLPAGPWWTMDFLGIVIPYQGYLRDSLLAGEIPFWNPHASLGRPFLADPQAVALWPGVVLYVVLGAHGGSYVLTVLHGCWAMHATARVALRFGAAPWAAAMAGWCFVFSPKLLGHVHAGHVQYAIAWLTLPAIVAALLELLRKCSALNIARLAWPVAWQLLAGAPQVFWCSALTVALLGLAIRLTGSRGAAEWRALVKDGLAVIAAYAWAAGLAAILLLPMFELVGQSNRQIGGAGALSTVGPLTWNEAPSFFSIWSQPNGLWNYELSLTPGLLIAVLGAAGWMLWSDRWLRALGLTMLGVVLLAAGPGTAWHDEMLRFLPGYGSFRVHARWAMVLVWGAAVSAAVFCSGTERRELRQIVILLVALLGLALIGAIYPSLWWDGEALRADWSLLPMILLVGAVLLALWLLREIRVPGRAAVRWFAIGSFVLAELAMVMYYFKISYPRENIPVNEKALTETLEFAGLLRANEPPPRGFLPPALVRANAGMIYGHGSLFGFESLGLSRPRSVIHWSMGVEPPDHTDFPDFQALNRRLPWPTTALDLQFGYDVARQAIVTRQDPAPRAWLAAQTQVHPDWIAAGRAHAADPRRDLARLEIADPRHGGLAGAQAGAVRITGYTRNKVRLQVETGQPGQPGLLVLAEPWYPGWRTTIDGKRVDAVPVNGWMRGAFVPAGAQEVSFEYVSTRFFAGLALSVLSLALLLIAMWRARPVSG